MSSPYFSARDKRAGEIHAPRNTGGNVTRFLRVSLEIRDYSQSTVNRLTRLRFKTLLFDLLSCVTAENATGSANENMAA